MSHSFIIKEGALVLSDVHYSHKRPQLLDFLKDILSQKISATQLILMGDIFDLLFGQISTTHKRNTEVIDTLNAISEVLEVHYLEGNHDYALKKLFAKIYIYPLATQPLTCKYKDKTVMLAHGDFNISKGYKYYSNLIRLDSIMYFLAFINFFMRGFIIKKLDTYLNKKEDCNDFKGFETYITRRLEGFEGECDYFIEGHFHQNKTFKVINFVYINVAAFACNQRYFIVESSKQDILRLTEVMYKEK